MNNSSQPYLYKNTDNKNCLFYCFADSVRSLVFDNEYQLRPWKIRHRNLTTNTDIPLATPSYIETYGDVILECNPHFISIENNRYLYYTAGFCKGHNEPILYYLCRILANELSEDYLSQQTLEILKNTFTGTYHNNALIYQRRDNIKANLYIDGPEPIVIDLSDTGLYDILKVNTIFNSDKLIVTGQKQDGSMASFILNANYSVNKEILNSLGMPVYKCSIMDNLLIYTIRHQDGLTIESRSLAMENIN